MEGVDNEEGVGDGEVHHTTSEDEGYMCVADGQHLTGERCHCNDKCEHSEGGSQTHKAGEG